MKVSKTGRSRAQRIVLAILIVGGLLVFLILPALGLVETLYRQLSVGDNPSAYPPARWEAQTPAIWFDIVPHEDYTANGGYYKGQAMTENGEIPIEVKFGAFAYATEDQIEIWARDPISKALCFLEGSCKFYPDRVVVSVDRETDTLFGGTYETIIFYRQMNEEETAEG